MPGWRKPPGRCWQPTTRSAMRRRPRSVRQPPAPWSAAPPPTEHHPTAMLTNGMAANGAAATRLEHAVAVMTFANITKEPADDWIGSGIAETVTADAKKIRGLAVIGRERIFEALKNLSSGQLAQSDEVIAIDLGRHLGARWILAGGYQKIGEMIR